MNLSYNRRTENANYPQFNVTPSSDLMASLRRYAARHAGGMVLALLAAGAMTISTTEAQAQTVRPYQRNVDNGQCAHNSLSTDRTACIKEAAAARQASRQQQLTVGTAAEAARARCAPLPEADRELCFNRIMSPHSDVSGSVQGGGTLRTHTEIIPAK